MVTLLLAALLVAAAPDTTPRVSAMIISTIGQSEWCPAGDVRLELSTGSFVLRALTRSPDCNSQSFERPVTQGVLGASDLERVRVAALKVQADGLVRLECRRGGKPGQVVISNDGPRHLALSTDHGLSWTPEDLSCWTESGLDLHRTLEEVFDTKGRP